MSVKYRTDVFSVKCGMKESVQWDVRTLEVNCRADKRFGVTWKITQSVARVHVN